jgi:hypothetical protein
VVEENPRYEADGLECSGCGDEVRRGDDGDAARLILKIDFYQVMTLLQWFGATLFPVILAGLSGWNCMISRLQIGLVVWLLSLAIVFISILLLPYSFRSRLLIAVFLIPFQIYVLTTAFLMISCSCTNTCL